MPQEVIRIATRKSPLALWQAEHVALRLRAAFPGLATELVTMVTRGDKLLDAPLAKVGGKGLFVKELEQGMLDGVADIAFVVLGPTGNQFPDRSIMELPGLFNDMREATLVYTRLIASGIMEGFNDFFVIGAFATDLESIHTRSPVATLSDLKGKRIRANNLLEAGVLAKLGMYPVVLPIGKAAEAISHGTIDGAATAPLAMIDFGVGRVATHHFMLSLGPTVITILMNRKKFESLPEASQAVIRRYSGEWLAARIVEGYAPYNKEIVEQLKSDPARKVTFPSQTDIDVAARAFKAARTEWADSNPHNRQLLNAAEAKLRQLRSTQ